MFQGTGQNIPGTLTSVPPLLVSKTEPDDSLNQLANAKKRPLEPESPASLDDEADSKLTEDEKAAKKQRRLLKNREAAAQFRHRQKAYMQKLEKHADDLTTSNAQVTAKIELLASENKLMKEQLGYLRNFMKNAVALSFPTMPPPALPPDSLVEASPDLTRVAPIPDLFPPLLDIDDTPSPTPDTTNPAITTTSTDVNFNIAPSPIPATTPTLSPIPSPTPSPANSVPGTPTSASPVPTPSSTPTLPNNNNAAVLNNIFNSILAQPSGLDPKVVVKTE